MRMKIYQIDWTKEENRDGFRAVDDLSKVDPRKYKKVLDSEVKVDNLLGAFYLFNSVDPHPLYSGTAMTASDVVVVEDGSFIWDGKLGFQKIDFDESLVNTSDQIRVLFVQPHEEPYVAEIPDTLQAKQRAVGGYIEYVYNADETALICDEEAKIKCKEGNRYLDGTGILAGNFLVVGLAGDENRSLSDEEVSKYKDKYSDPPEISQEETGADVGFAIMSF